MDRFMELPLPQKLLLVGVIMAILGGASYFLLISPVSDEIAAQSRKYKSLMTDYGKLKEFDSPEFKERMEREQAEADKRAQSFAKMLPREEELPDLITSIKNDADNAGLTLIRFDPVKKREEGEGYRALFFNVDVVGTYAQFLMFLESLSAPSKRLINIKNLSLEPAPASSIEKTAGDIGLLRVLNEREKQRGLTANERYVKTLLLFDENAKNTLLKASFTAVAYVYTGAIQQVSGVGPQGGGAK